MCGCGWSRELGGKHARALMVLVLVAAAGPACSDDDDGKATPTGGAGDGAGTGAGAGAGSGLIIDVGDLPDAVVPAGSGGAGAGAGGGAGMFADGGIDAAPSREPFDAGGVALSGGVLTNLPHFGFINTGTSGIVITSAFIRVLEGSFASVLLHGELENRSDVTRCIPLFDVAFVGTQEVIAVADAPPYQPTGDITSVYGCLAPDEKGAWHGIQNEVSPTLLEEATEFRYAISGLQRDYTPHPLTPVLLSSDRVSNGSAYRITGQIRSASMPIYNTAIVFYAKNELGLVVDDTSAYPRDLDTIAPNSTLAYESFPFSFYDGEPEGLIYFFDFLEGTRPP